jgi:uncharacterized protein (TIGR03067 family)
MSIHALLPVIALLVAGQDPEPPRDVKKELARLQGEWAMVARETNGKQEPDEQVKKERWRLTIKGDQCVFTLREGKGRNERAEFTIAIDPFKHPKALDWGASPGIYRLQGDTLTICRTVGNRPRPKEFKTFTVSDSLSVWKRVKK